jgi:hypothetical protein
MCEELVGYLLGALEPEEAAALENKLKLDPALRRQLEALRDRLRPVIEQQDGARRTMIDPPAGLADRVCKRVAQERSAEAAAAADAAQPAAVASSWHRVDAATVVGLSLAALVLIVPVLVAQRYQSEAVACRQRMNLVGRALVDYSRGHHGYFPQLAAEGNLARAGVYAVTLRDSGYLTDDADLFCPAVATDAVPSTLPTRNVLVQALPVDAATIFRQMDGVHGYALGYVESGRYHASRNRDRAHYAVLGDAPHELGEGGRNHGNGQNVWFEDGHAEFLRRSRLTVRDDAIYHNHDGLVGAGVGADDVVLGGPGARPLLTPVSHGD